MKIEMGIGWMQDPEVTDGLVSAGPSDYVAEIERLRAALVTIAGAPERDPDLPPIYQPRWSDLQCREIARAALNPKT